VASALRALQIDDGASEAVWILPGDVLYGVGDCDEVVRRKRRRNEHDPHVLEVPSDEFPGQLNEISEISAAVSWAAESCGNARRARSRASSRTKSRSTSQTPKPVPATFAVRPLGSAAK
jgi:hypothetical protein